MPKVPQTSAMKSAVVLCVCLLVVGVDGRRERDEDPLLSTDDDDASTLSRLMSWQWAPRHHKGSNATALPANKAVLSSALPQMSSATSNHLDALKELLAKGQTFHLTKPGHSSGSDGRAGGGVFFNYMTEMKSLSATNEDQSWTHLTGLVGWGTETMGKGIATNLATVLQKDVHGNPIEASLKMQGSSMIIEAPPGRGRVLLNGAWDQVAFKDADMGVKMGLGQYKFKIDDAWSFTFNNLSPAFYETIDSSKAYAPQNLSCMEEGSNKDSYFFEGLVYALGCKGERPEDKAIVCDAAAIKQITYQLEGVIAYGTFGAKKTETWPTGPDGKDETKERPAMYKMPSASGKYTADEEEFNKGVDFMMASYLPDKDDDGIAPNPGKGWALFKPSVVAIAPKKTKTLKNLNAWDGVVKLNFFEDLLT